MNISNFVVEDNVPPLNPNNSLKRSECDPTEEELKVQENFSKLEDTFALLAYSLLGELEEKNVSVGDIMKCLAVIPWSKNKEIYNLIYKYLEEMNDKETLRNLS